MLTPFAMLLILVSCALASVWLVRARWLPAATSFAAHVTPCAHMRRLLGASAALGVFVLAGPVACYLLLGAPSQSASAMGPASAASAPKALKAPRSQRAELPDGDAERWQTLARDQASQGEHVQALAAYEAALRLHPDDAALLAEAAFSAAVIDPQGRSNEAAQMVAHALRSEPNNTKALALAGTLALDRKDYEGAARYWEQLAQVEPPDSPGARQLRVSIHQARWLARRQAGEIQLAAR